MHQPEGAERSIRPQHPGGSVRSNMQTNLKGHMGVEVSGEGKVPSATELRADRPCLLTGNSTGSRELGAGRCTSRQMWRDPVARCAHV